MGATKTWGLLCIGSGFFALFQEELGLCVLMCCIGLGMIVWDR